MNILDEIKKITEQCRERYLPQVEDGDLEESGAVYFMNAKDGVEFEWHVNNKLPPFMMFYDNKNGAVKLLLNRDGTVSAFAFDCGGENMCGELHTRIECDEEKLTEFAVLLKRQTDDIGKWDVNIKSLRTDVSVNDEMKTAFLNRRSMYDKIKEIRTLMNQCALVSRKIVDEGWKVGFMYRQKPNNPKDSGWVFLAGNEDDEYNSNVQNIALMMLGQLCRDFDKDVYKYITAPIGSEFIRISETEFEPDMKNKPIFLAKRQNNTHSG